MTARSVKLPRGASGGGGFTLIELLAVIVIVTLATGIVTVGLASANTSAQLRGAIAQWRTLDARARMLSRALGAVTMHYEEHSQLLQLSRVESDELLAKIQLPKKVHADLVTEHPTDTVVFDRLGRSADYDVRMMIDDRVVAWHVCGLTGYITEPRR
ncbi:MAG: prepilin-type N-terminal cleavage/methylation domain-containing protein [Phycisphaerales bacterium]